LNALSSSRSLDICWLYVPIGSVILLLENQYTRSELKPMSRTCGITLDLETTQHSRLDLLLLLIRYGWQFDGLYLPLGDNGMYDWQAISASEWPTVLPILKAKEVHNEQLALGLHWQEQLIGGTFHIDPVTARLHTYRLWTIWSADRPRLIDDYWFTDHNWYLKRIVPAFQPKDVSVVSIVCSDVY
jgi:hypothetical protein